MSFAFDSSLIAPIAIGALVVWRLQARLRRMVGRQRLSSLRPWVTIVVFPIVLALLGLGAFVRSAATPTEEAGAGVTTLVALVVGIAIGIGLGRIGTRLTRFEATPAGLFYTPNAHLGIALSLLLVLRIGYRFVQLRMQDHGFAFGSPQTTGSPITLAIFGTLAGYYVTYAIGLLRWRASVRARE